MIGFILTGHGSFSEGLMGAVEMIAGPQEDFKVVPFKECANHEGFEDRMRNAVEELKKTCSDVVIFSDLMGGSPFRTAMLVSQEIPGVEVITGTNMPILIEAIGLRYAEDNSAALIEQALQAAKDGLVNAKLEIRDEAEDEESDEEGI